MDTVIIVIQFILSLSILVILHEFGHFLPARIFKVRVEKFYLFFDAWVSLFKIKRGETEYGVGWLPLGGYVKLSGMVDESFDREQMKLPPKPYEFRSKPAWQRLIIMLGGVIVNFLLGFFIFAMLLWSYGETYLPAENISYGIQVDSLGQELGLESGDKILKVGDQPFEEFNPGLVVRGIALDNAKTITVERNGSIVDLPVEERFVDELTRYSNKSNTLFSARVPFIVEAVPGDGPASAAGFEVGDRVVAVDGQEKMFVSDISSYLNTKKNENVLFSVLREGTMDTLQLPVTTTDDGKIGVGLRLPQDIFGTAKKDYSLMAAFPAGVNKGVTFLTDQFKAFGQMFRGKIKASESLGGFGTIGGLFPKSFDWERFWTVTAILSLILGFMNLLPIPALDGGHVMFLIWEVVTGKKVSDRVMEIATTIGFVLIISLVLYANGLDIMRLFNK